jgi:hypothetical protein
MTAKSPTPLSNAQVEILKTFSVDLNENELQDFKKILHNFYYKKLEMKQMPNGKRKVMTKTL